jgi:DNA phosphorothioation-dependent restriction protein DptG
MPPGQQLAFVEPTKLVYRTSVSTNDLRKKKLAQMLAGLELATIETVSSCMP